VSINPLSDTTFALAEAARRLPCLRNGRPVHPSTLWRWASRGLRGVRLATIRIGGTTCTSLEALQRFFEQIGPDVVNSTPTPQSTTRRGEVVSAALDSIGI